MLASTLGIPFEVDQSWDEKKQVFRMSGQIVRTKEITQTATGPKNGQWVTTVACAVMIMDWQTAGSVVTVPRF